MSIRIRVKLRLGLVTRLGLWLGLRSTRAHLTNGAIMADGAQLRAEIGEGDAVDLRAAGASIDLMAIATER